MPPLSRSKAYYLLVCAEVLRPVKATSCAACEYMYCTMTLLNKSARKASLTFGNCGSLAGHRTLLCREKRPHCRPRSQSYLLLEADRTAPWPNAVASSSAAMCRLVNPDWSPPAKNTRFLLLRCWTVRHARPEYRQTKPSTKDNVCAVRSGSKFTC